MRTHLHLGRAIAFVAVALLVAGHAATASAQNNNRATRWVGERAQQHFKGVRRMHASRTALLTQAVLLIQRLRGTLWQPTEIQLERRGEQLLFTAKRPVGRELTETGRIVHSEQLESGAVRLQARFDDPTPIVAGLRDSPAVQKRVKVMQRLAPPGVTAGGPAARLPVGGTLPVRARRDPGADHPRARAAGLPPRAEGLADATGRHLRARPGRGRDRVARRPASARAVVHSSGWTAPATSSRP